MTGLLVFSALFDCLDVYCAAGCTSCRTFCSTDCVLLAGFGLSLRRVSKYWTMATEGAALVENRAGITFGVELYVPWDAPEAVVDISSAGVVPLRSIPDAIGLTGSRADAVECCVLQGRDVRSVRVLMPLLSTWEKYRSHPFSFRTCRRLVSSGHLRSSVTWGGASRIWRGCVWRPSSGSVRIDQVVVCTVAYGLSVTCIGMW